MAVIRVNRGWFSGKMLQIYYYCLACGRSFATLVQSSVFKIRTNFAECCEKKDFREKWKDSCIRGKGMTSHACLVQTHAELQPDALVSPILPLLSRSSHVPPAVPLLLSAHTVPPYGCTGSLGQSAPDRLRPSQLLCSCFCLKGQGARRPHAIFRSGTGLGEGRSCRSASTRRTGA